MEVRMMSTAAGPLHHRPRPLIAAAVAAGKGAPEAPSLISLASVSSRPGRDTLANLAAAEEAGLRSRRPAAIALPSPLLLRLLSSRFTASRLVARNSRNLSSVSGRQKPRTATSASAAAAASGEEPTVLPPGGTSRSSSGSSSSSSSNSGIAAAAGSEEVDFLGGSSGVGMGAADGARKELLHEALQRLSTEDIETASRKYKLQEELFGELDFARINAFSGDAFGGNPAAVVYLPYMLSNDWLQRVAREFNLSETAFLVRRRKPLLSAAPSQQAGAGGMKPRGGRGRMILGNEFDLRWFTPETEVKLCGHATLASAHLIFTAGLVEPDCDTLVFHTLSGALQARRVLEAESPLARKRPAIEQGEAEEEGGREGEEVSAGTGFQQSQKKKQQPQGKQRKEGASSSSSSRPSGRGVIEIDLPLLPPVPVPESEWGEIEAALGMEPGSALWVGRNSLHYVMVEVESAEAVLITTPDMVLLGALPIVGAIVTAPGLSGSSSSSSGFGPSSANGPLARADFVARFFAPQCGIDEDPVTGSAFCTLGPYWAQRLGKSQLVGFQASQRGGEVAVTIDGDSQRVQLQGWAVIVMAGVLMNTVGPTTAAPTTSKASTASTPTAAAGSS